jgi:hypothetical protein
MAVNCIWFCGRNSSDWFFLRWLKPRVYSCWSIEFGNAAFSLYVAADHGTLKPRVFLLKHRIWKCSLFPICCCWSWYFDYVGLLTISWSCYILMLWDWLLNASGNSLSIVMMWNYVSCPQRNARFVQAVLLQVHAEASCMTVIVLGDSFARPCLS